MNWVERLKKHWDLNSNLDLFLIILTFAIGGSLCGRLAKFILKQFSITQDFSSVSYWLLYIVAMTILWPICVITVSVLTGQFQFFKKYLKKVFRIKS
jgi:enoyl-[acyl-carrier-protein] reductase (NADH)